MTNYDLTMHNTLSRAAKTGFLFAGVMAIWGVTAGSAPLQAQIDPEQAPLVRAKNLARQAGERANGGITQYRSEPAMHGPVEESPFVQNLDGSWTFTFQGCDRSLIGPLGQCTRYSIQTVVTVTPTGGVTLEENQLLP